MKVETEKWLERDKKVLAGVLPRCSSLVAASGAGSWLTDVDGRDYLDFTSGIAVNTLGHCHPAVVAAIQEQAQELIHVSVTTHHVNNILLAEKLSKISPFDNGQVFLCNSGAEAVDGALKFARFVTGKTGIIGFDGSFHGRTVAGTSLTTSKMRYRSGYTNLPWVKFAEYGKDLEYLEKLVQNSQAGGYSTGCVILEPVLGEGGYVVPSVEWLQGVRDICTRAGVLLVFDEVQTGIGRTGHWFAAQGFGVKPDVLLFAKGVASGMPLGGIIAERELFEQWPEGRHGSTFGGNPVSCAAALATLEELERGAWLIEVRKNSMWIKEQLGTSALPVSVRGLGYMIGIEFENGTVAAAVKDECLNRGLLVLTCGRYDEVVRLIPPLNALGWELQLGVSVLLASMEIVAGAEAHVSQSSNKSTGNFKRF